MPTDARKAQNEVWFRELNERLETRALAQTDSDEMQFEIVCECSREECTERIRVAYGTYEHVRQHPTYFILVTGHLEPSIERLLSVHHGYEIVEKLGLSAAVANADDPRA
jgi:hypothetical protein